MSFRLPLAVAALCSASCALSFAQLTVTLTPNVAPPQQVGTPITFTAAASGGSGYYDYQFTANISGAPRQIKQDFDAENTFSWTPAVKEGMYTIGVTARDLTNKGIRGYMTFGYEVTPALVSGAQAVHATANPLVALFSAPACPAGDSLRVIFFQFAPSAGLAGSQPKSATNKQPCDNVTSMNFYMAGMYANSTYIMLWQTLDKSGNQVATGAPLHFRTGGLPAGVVAPSPIAAAASSPNLTDPDQQFPVIMQGFVPTKTPYTTTATDLAGNILWMLPYEAPLFTRTEPGGKVFFLETPLIVQSNPDPYAQQIREVDLAGNQLIQSNAEIVSEQLVAMGKHPITGFSHELMRLPNGGLMTIGVNERIVANGNQCGYTGGQPNTCDVLGDAVIVLNANLQVTWAWDAFDQGAYTDAHGTHQLVDQPAVLGETCTPNYAGCPAFYLAPVANDWTHSNSLQLMADGNIIISIRHLDWVVKLNYANGAGDGHILWRMGPNGDFSLTTINTQGTEDLAVYPWFSHQHQPAFAFNDAFIDGVEILTVFDDGNTRIADVGGVGDPNGHSRGQVYAVNEAALQANLNTNADLGQYSFALGSAQILPNGNMFFDAGAIGPKPGPWYGLNVETDPNGVPLFILQIASGTQTSSALTYRSFRMPSLYGATQ